MKHSAYSALLAVALAASVSAQQSAWGQCGGFGFSGSASCVSGYTCVYINDWYSQCQPGAAATTQTTTSQAPTPTSSSGSSGSSGSSSGSSSSSGPTSCPALPSGLGSSSSTLPNPFNFQSGTQVSSANDWACRQAEISYQMQRYELGTMPDAPDSVQASYSGGTLSITVSDNGGSISFSVSISTPSGSGPFPAIINFGSYGSSLPIPSNVATIGFNNDDIAAQNGASSRGSGKFYNLYGSSHSAGALMAWAWAVSRIMDALEQTQSQTNIDPTRIGVTGCSRNGKGAMVAGAFDSRIALTLPQESGAGGAGCWRIEDWQNSNGYSVQDAAEIIGENVWFSTNFNSYVNNVNQLPFDHHMLAGLVAPRAMYIMENPDYEWLGTMSTYGCMGAARKQWEALGALDSFGYSQVGGHSHCSFPSAQQSELTAFINKFLLNQSANTGVFRTDQNYNFNIDSWAPWSVPSLS